jgi:hypothetical protein
MLPHAPKKRALEGAVSLPEAGTTASFLSEAVFFRLVDMVLILQLILGRLGTQVLSKDVTSKFGGE